MDDLVGDNGIPSVSLKKVLVKKFENVAGLATKKTVQRLWGCFHHYSLVRSAVIANAYGNTANVM